VVAVASKTQLTVPAIWIVAVPLVPQFAEQTPITPLVSVVAAITAVDGAPVSFVRVLVVVPVELALLTW